MNEVYRFLGLREHDLSDTSAKNQREAVVLPGDRGNQTTLTPEVGSAP